MREPVNCGVIWTDAQTGYTHACLNMNPHKEHECSCWGQPAPPPEERWKVNILDDNVVYE